MASMKKLSYGYTSIIVLFYLFILSPEGLCFYRSVRIRITVANCQKHLISPQFDKFSFFRDMNLIAF